MQKTNYWKRLLIIAIISFALGMIFSRYILYNTYLFISSIFPFLLLFGCLILIHILDGWSTKTLFATHWMYLHDKEYRERIVEDELKEDIGNRELNPLVRWFIKKFGVMKGLKITTYFVSLPVFTILGSYAWFVYPGDPAIYISYVLIFYVGAIYTQLLRASVTKKKLERMGYDVDELTKGNKIK